VNANTNSTASAIAAQPNPTAGTVKFLALKPRLFIDGEWVEALSGVEMYTETKSVCIMI
jgi:hypothetical protein